MRLHHRELSALVATHIAEAMRESRVDLRLYIRERTLARSLLARYPALLAARYGFSLKGMDGIALIEAIAKKRGMRGRGGDPDFSKASLVLLQDYRGGTLGRISLETPHGRREMVDADLLAEKAAAARKAKAEARKGRSNEVEQASAAIEHDQDDGDSR